MAAAYGVGARLGTLALLVLTAAAPARLLVIGDSLAAGYGLPHAEGFEVQLKQALAGTGQKVQVIDAAVSGATSADGLARLDWVLGGIPRRGPPLAAVLELGANDGLRGLPVRDLRANLTAILNRLAARHIPVLLAGMYAPPNLGPGYERRFRAVYAALGRRPGVVLEPFFLAGVARVPSLNQPDLLHPNATGVKRVVATILPYVRRVLALAEAK
ncbi:MAG: arylesterase [Acetobacteraceae bacterium]